MNRNDNSLFHVLIVLALSFSVGPSVSLAAESVVDRSYVARSGERVLKQSLVLDAPAHEVWDLYTTAAGLVSWAAPVAEVDLRIGGTIRSSFKVGGTLGEPGTVVTEVVNLIPEAELVLRDDLIDLLTMGGLFEWLDIFPQEFLTQLEDEGDDLFTTTRFESADGDRTRLTVLSYGYGEGDFWDRVYEEGRKSNIWFLDNLAKRLAEGPIDWSKQQ